MTKHPSETWHEMTPPDSLSAMRKAIEANTATSNAALEWSVKTYELVAPLTRRISAVERVQRIGVGWPLMMAALAVALSSAALACEVLR